MKFPLAKLFGYVFLCLGVSDVIAQAPAAKPIPLPPGINLNDPKALLSYAASVNGLDADVEDKDASAPGMTPWHLKAGFEAFDDGGNALGNGVFEEWHMSSKQWKRSFTGTRFTQTEYRTPAGHFYGNNSGGAPWPESLIEHALIHPMPDKDDTEDTSPTLEEKSFGNLGLACVMLTQAGIHQSFGTKWPLGLFPTYCFDKDDAILRYGLFDGSIDEIFNKLAVFEGRYIAKESELSENGKPLLRIHLMDLRSMPAAEAATLAPPPTAMNADVAPVSVEQGVMRGYKVRGPDPVYPAAAKSGRIQGKVVLKAVIGTDGRIHQLRVISSPHSLLSTAALAAVQRWVYKPYLLAGLPVKVDTTINVIFNMGG